MGSYFETDSEGFVINPASLEKVQEEWKPVIDDIIEGYKKYFGEHLTQIYVRGSVVKGQAVKNVSDIDTFGYVDLPAEEIDNSKNKEFKESLKEKYPFVEGFEFWADPQGISESRAEQIILNQAVCVYGEPIEVRKMKPGKEMMLHSPALDSYMSQINQKLEEETSAEKLKIWFIARFKKVLRAGFEITMERSGLYTRDLYKCYEGFVKYYPEKEPEMREVLNLILNPTADKEKLRKVSESIVPWLTEESKKYI